MLSILLLVFSYMDTWQFTDTEIFQPLRPSDVAVNPEGSIYVTNFTEAHILLLDQEGKLQRKIGRKGKGPGEFTYPRYTHFVEGKLYVYDLLNAQISIFKADGSFIERIDTPDRGIALAKGSKGWLYGNWSTFTGTPGDTEAVSEVFWVDDQFQNQQQVLKDLPKGHGQGGMVMQNNSDITAIYSPLNTQPSMITNGQYAYIKHPHQAKVYVFDFANKRLLDAIEFEHRPIPFDTEWGETQFEISRQNSRGSGPPNGQWKKAFPERFPAIRGMYLDPDGNLVVDLWRGKPDDNHHLLTLNNKGEVLPNTYDYEFLNRYLGKSNDGSVFVTIFDVEEEMAGIARVAKDKAVAFVKDNPIEYDGDTGYSISISN